ncbi:Fructose-bisphosphatase [Bacillus amyloliquefaciens]|nr:Fructose-bisphosphatase [Bacillus amyloliquefaciens]
MNDGFFLGLGKPLALRNMRRKVWLEENPRPLKESEGKIRKTNGKVLVMPATRSYNNSYYMQLVAHKHLEVLGTGTDVLTMKQLVDKELEWKKVKETNVGGELLQEVAIC